MERYQKMEKIGEGTYGGESVVKRRFLVEFVYLLTLLLKFSYSRVQSKRSSHQRNHCVKKDKIGG